MYKQILLAGFAIIQTASLLAQNNLALIKGKIAEKDGRAVAAATVILSQSADSALVKSAISESDGSFELPGISEGSYRVSVTAIGFNEWASGIITVSKGQSLTLPEIILRVATSELGTVVVNGRKPMIEVKADKTIFNVESSITAQGSNGLELLQRTPGLQVDNNDNISMKGKTGVKVYVDGKMLQLGAQDLAAYLRSINSNDIEAIEMISNPSAKYDASGNAGIINIRLKKNKKYGTNGSVNLGYIQGVTPKGNGSVNLNYRDKQVNLFGNLSSSRGNYENNMDLYRIQNDTIYDQKALQVSRNKNVNAKLGADFFVNERSTLGLMATINSGQNKWSGESNTLISDEATGTPVRILKAGNAIPGSRTNANVNLNYRFVDTTGTEINIDADYGLFRGTGRSFQPNTYYNMDGSVYDFLAYANYTPTDIDIYTLKGDAERKAFGGKLGYGAKFSYVYTRNTFDFYNIEQGKPELDLNKSNRFNYKENVNAAYVNFNRQFNPKWSLQAGLRMEQTNSDGELTRADGQEQEDGSVVRNYLDWFPSAALTWTLDKKNTLNLTYSRRIDRPTYQELNPFENKLDELTYQKGNAFLKPQYTDNVELAHTFMGFLTTKAGYSYVKDYSTRITDTTNGNATYLQQRNLGSQQIISFSVGSALPIRKWWNGYINLWYNYQIYDGEFNNGKLHEELSAYGAYLQQTFNITKKGLAAELSGWYNGPSIWGGTWRVEPMGNLDIGVQHPLFKKKGSIKLSMTDVLGTNYWKSVTDFGGVYINGQGRWESRTLRLNFTYRFGSNEVKAARQRKTGLEQEAGRIN